MRNITKFSNCKVNEILQYINIKIFSGYSVLQYRCRREMKSEDQWVKFLGIRFIQYSSTFILKMMKRPLRGLIWFLIIKKIFEFSGLYFHLLQRYRFFT